MIVLLKLILAHLIGDFFLQPRSWIQEKEEKKARSLKIYLHVLIHGILILLLLWDWKYLFLAIILILAHFGIDLLKLYSQKKKTRPVWFIIDQVLHLLSILILWTIWENPEISIREILQNTNLIIVATALLFLTLPAGILLATVLKKWSDKIPQDSNQSLENAGKYIGILERLFVFGFILTDHWEAVGFLIAAKSVFRFGDLKKSKERKLTEYILIGTLLSFGIAMVVGILSNYLMTV